MNKFIVQLHTYRNYLVIYTPDPDMVCNDWVPAHLNNDPGRNSLRDTARWLGASFEVAERLRLFRPSVAEGHIDWFELVNKPGVAYFEWMGGANRVIPFHSIQVGKGFRVAGFTVIANEPPAEARARIDQKYLSMRGVWAAS